MIFRGRFGANEGGGAVSTGSRPGAGPPPVAPELEPYQFMALNVWDTSRSRLCWSPGKEGQKSTCTQRCTGDWRPRTSSDLPKAPAILGQAPGPVTWRDWATTPWHIFSRDASGRSAMYTGCPGPLTPDLSIAGKLPTPWDQALRAAVIAHYRENANLPLASDPSITLGQYADKIEKGEASFTFTTREKFGRETYFMSPATRWVRKWDKFFGPATGGKIVIVESEYPEKSVNPIPYLTSPFSFVKRVVCDLSTNKIVTDASVAAAGLDPRAATVSAAIATVCGGVVATPAPTTPTESKYPAGAITMFDKKLGKWRVAVPA